MGFHLRFRADLGGLPVPEMIDDLSQNADRHLPGQLGIDIEPHRAFQRCDPVFCNAFLHQVFTKL